MTDIDDKNCGAPELANELFTSLSGTFVVPDIDLSGTEFTPIEDPNSALNQIPESVELSTLTTVELDGDGVFDKLMSAVDLHIAREFKDGRIDATAYAQVYTDSIANVLANATQFTLAKDIAKWNAIKSQMEAKTSELEVYAAKVGLVRAKMEVAKLGFDAQNSGAQYSLTKLNLATTSEQFCLLKEQVEAEKFSNEQMLPIALKKAQHELNCQIPTQFTLLKEQVEAQRGQTMDTRTDGRTPIRGLIGLQKEGVIAETAGKVFNTTQTLPAQLEILEEQLANLEKDTATKAFALTNTLPAQLNILEEQRESERAKTKDTRSDNSTVAGSIGKQVDLYEQQIESFKLDGKHKTAKMYLDAWITQKTLDEGLTVPSELNNSAVGTVITSLKNASNL